MFRVIKMFTDLHDGDHLYNVGDEFPREGVEVSVERLAELSSSANLRREPLIEFVEDEINGDDKKNVDEPIEKVKEDVK